MTHSILKQANTSDSNLDQQMVQNQSIAEQFNKLKELLVLKDTVKTFAKSLQLLFLVIKESLILCWLACCWCIVAISLVSDRSIQLGQTLKDGWHSLFNQDKSGKEIAAATMRQSLHNLVTKAKKQVGFQVD